jgi:hypothetical protein
MSLRLDWMCTTGCSPSSARRAEISNKFCTCALLAGRNTPVAKQRTERCRGQGKTKAASETPSADSKHQWVSADQQTASKRAVGTSTLPTDLPCTVH